MFEYLFRSGYIDFSTFLYFIEQENMNWLNALFCRREVKYYFPRKLQVSCSFQQLYKNILQKRMLEWYESRIVEKKRKFLVTHRRMHLYFS